MNNTVNNLEFNPCYSKGAYHYFSPRGPDGKRLHRRWKARKSPENRDSFITMLQREFSPQDSTDTLYPLLDKYVNAISRNGKKVSPKTRSCLKEKMPHLGVRKEKDDTVTVTGIAAMRLCDIKREDCENTIDPLVAADKLRTAQKVHELLNAVLREAVLDKKLTENPMARVPTPHYKPRKRLRTFTRTEMEFLLQAVKGDPLEALFLLAYTTGMRPCEFYGLQWSDVNLYAGTIEVCRDLVASSETGHVPTLGPTKTGKERTVSLGPRVVAALRERRKMNMESAFVFTSRDGKPLRHSNVIRRWWKPLQERAAQKAEEAARAAGYPEYRFPILHMYALRHTHIMRAKRYLTPAELAERVGHSPQMTLQAYRNVSDEEAAASAKTLDEVLLGGPLATTLATTAQILALPAAKDD